MDGGVTELVPSSMADSLSAAEKKVAFLSVVCVIVQAMPSTNIIYFPDLEHLSLLSATVPGE
jgi:hypothetical protein